MHAHTHVHMCKSAYADTAEELVDIAIILFYIYTYIGGVGYKWWVFRSTVVGSYALLGTVPLKFSQKHCLVLTHSLSLSLSSQTLGVVQFVHNINVKKIDIKMEVHVTFEWMLVVGRYVDDIESHWSVQSSPF